ncbi:MAG: hypothetical protein ACI9XU_001948 [Arenicella sp.]
MRSIIAICLGGFQWNGCVTGYFCQYKNNYWTQSMKMSSQNGFMTRKVFSTTMIIVLSVMLAACGGKRKTTDINGEPIVDMTRPPVMINDIKEQTVESDPDEVISYEKWKQKRDEDLGKDANKGSEGDPE